MQPITHKELRVGNWVKYDGRYFKIHSIAEVFPILDTEEFGIGVVDYNNIQPIPLTASILEQAGFVKNSTTWQHPTDNSGVFIDERLKSIRHELRYDPLTLNLFKDGKFYVETYYSGIEIKSLHQLQNFYYALTGKELTINL